MQVTIIKFIIYSEYTVSVVILLLLTVGLLVKHSKAKYYYCNVHSLRLKPPKMVARWSSAHFLFTPVQMNYLLCQ